MKTIRHFVAAALLRSYTRRRPRHRAAGRRQRPGPQYLWNADTGALTHLSAHKGEAR